VATRTKEKDAEKCAHQPSGAGLLEDSRRANRAWHPKHS